MDMIISYPPCLLFEYTGLRTEEIKFLLLRFHNTYFNLFLYQ